MSSRDVATASAPRRAAWPRALRAVLGLACLGAALPAQAQVLEPTTPPSQRGRIDAERQGTHDANRIRTWFYNYGMVGDYQTNPDLSVFHSVEVPKGTGLNYSDGITPYVLARITQENGQQAYVMLTGFRERQAVSPFTNRTMRFEPRPGYAEPNPDINRGRSVAISNDPRTWPGAASDDSGEINPSSDPTQCWYDRITDPDDPGWCGSWNGFFGKRPNADQESFSVMDDQFYDAWVFTPDARDATRRGLALRVEVRGFQWANPQAQNVIFWHYDIVNEGTVTYDDIIFGLYMDSGVGGAAIGCDGIAESDDDNARFSDELGLNLVYTWDERGHGISRSSNCANTGYLGYAYLETPGDATNSIDDDEDGITDERRDGGPGDLVTGQSAIRAAVTSRYNLTQFEATYGPLEERPAYIAGEWWTGDEDLDWTAQFSDTGADGIYSDEANPPDTGENDGMPTAGEPNFDRTDITESDQIGLTGFKLNRIAGSGQTDNVVFFTGQDEWPRRLYQQFSDPNPDVRFDRTVVRNYNVGFLFASGPFQLSAGRRERFSLALAYGQNLTELSDNIEVVQSIYDANYQFATPPPTPTLQAFAGDGRVTLVWDDVAERSADPVSNRNDFEGYRIYRSTDINFLDAQLIRDGNGNGPLGNGRPIAQFDLIDGVEGFSNLSVQGVQYYLGTESGLTHTWVDSTVTNGQQYYYAISAYDYGSEEFGFYPSENAISISRTTRGGTVLPRNTVEVRPNAQVPGYVTASINPASIQQVAGDGEGTLDVRVLNPAVVPDGHTFRIDFYNSPDSVRAERYALTDVTTGEVVFEFGRELSGSEAGLVGAGLQPIISTPATVSVDPDESGFESSSTTGVRLSAAYDPTGPPANLARTGFPEDLQITFSDTPVTTSVAAIGLPAIPAKFRITGAESGTELRFRFRDTNNNNTLDAAGEYIVVMTPLPGTTSLRVTWRIDVATASTDVPNQGDVYRLALNRPFGNGDAFTFTTRGSYVDPDQARSAFELEEPYVVPNPYVASASFEPERFATAGRGDRRLEFRAIPAGSTIRIYDVRGRLVQTLVHDGSTTGIVSWDLRTRDNLNVAGGLYIFHVDAGGLGDFTGRFAIIK